MQILFQIVSKIILGETVFLKTIYVLIMSILLIIFQVVYIGFLVLYHFFSTFINELDKQIKQQIGILRDSAADYFS